MGHTHQFRFIIYTCLNLSGKEITLLGRGGWAFQGQKPMDLGIDD